MLCVTWLKAAPSAGSFSQSDSEGGINDNNKGAAMDHGTHDRRRRRFKAVTAADDIKVAWASRPCLLTREANMPDTKESKNKALVLKAFDALFNRRDYAQAERYWSSGYVQHSAHIKPGREGFSTS